MINVGIIGCGYWGPNLVRNFALSSEAKILGLCDIDIKRAERLLSIVPDAIITSNFEEITKHPKIDAVAIATPALTHYEICKSALENEKFILVEKPFTSSSKQALDLIEIAEKKNLKILVDHTFIFTSAISKIKEFEDSG